MATVMARSGGGGGTGAGAQLQEDIVLRILEQVQLNMLKFQSQFNELNLKIEQLEQAQKNLSNNNTNGTSVKSSSEVKSEPTEPPPSSAEQPNADQANHISSQEITRLDGRIDVLVKEMSILRKDLKLDEYDDKSLLLDTSSAWKGGLNSTSMIALAGDDFDDEDDEEHTLDESTANVSSIQPSTSIFETTKTDNEEESTNYAGGLGDDEDEDGENVAMTIQPEIYLDESDQDDDTNDMSQGGMGVDDGDDNSMDMDDDDQSNDNEFEAGSEDEQAQSAYFSVKGQRDNGIEYKIIKATGKHQCPLFPVCQVECLSRRNLMRHYYNTHASTVTFQCPICGIGYARKDNLSKHYKKKHEDDYGPLQNAAAQARPRVEYEQQQQRMLHQRQGVAQVQRRIGLHGGLMRPRPGPVPRGMVSGGHPRPHRCNLCGITYNWRKNLNHHMKAKHGQLMPPGTRGPQAAPLVKPGPQAPTTATNYVTCRLCPTSFRTTEELARHYSIRHRATGRPTAHINASNVSANDGGTNQCPVCYKLFSNREILKRHISMHRSVASTPISNTITVAQTSIMPTSSTSAAAAAMEEAGVAGVLGPDGIVHDKQCRICFKEFTRREHVKRHMKLHSGHERYACVACDKVYSRKDQLRQHQRQTHGQVLELEPEPMNNGGDSEYDQ